MTLRTVSTPATVEADPYSDLVVGILRQAVRDAGKGNQEAVHFLHHCDDFLEFLDMDPGCFRRKMATIRG